MLLQSNVRKCFKKKIYFVEFLLNKIDVKMNRVGVFKLKNTSYFNIWNSCNEEVIFW